MNVDDVKDLSQVEPISFDNKIDIQLWDRDASPTGDEDDLLGKLTVQSFQAGVGEQKHEFKQKKARYTLSYIVE